MAWSVGQSWRREIEPVQVPRSAGGREGVTAAPVGMGRGRLGSSPAERGVGVVSSSGGASSVPWHQEGTKRASASWGASKTVEAGGQGRGLSRCVQRWRGFTWSTVCGAGPHHWRRMGRSSDGAEEGKQGGDRAGRHVLCGVSERWGLVSSGEQEAEGRARGSVQLPEEGTWRGRC